MPSDPAEADPCLDGWVRACVCAWKGQTSNLCFVQVTHLVFPNLIETGLELTEQVRLAGQRAWGPA